MRISYWSSDVCSSDLPYDAQIPQRLERAQRIGIIFALLIDSAHPRPLDEIVGQDLVPQVDDFLAFREEAVTADVEAKALMLDRAADAADIMRDLLDRSEERRVGEMSGRTGRLW